MAQGLPSRRLEPEGDNWGVAIYVVEGAEDFARAVCAIVHRDGSVSESWVRLEAPYQEVCEGPDFLPQEVVVGPIRPRCSHRGLDVGSHGMGQGVVVFPGEGDTGSKGEV